MAVHIVTTLSSINISYTSFYARGSFTEYPSCYIGFQYKLGVGGTVYYTSTSSQKKSPGEYTTKITGVPGPGILYPESIYYYRFRIQDGANYYYGEWLAVQTLAVVVNTGPTENIEETKATLKGDFLYSSACYTGFLVKLGIDGVEVFYSANYYKVNPGVIFNKNMTGLIPNSQYYYRSRIEDNNPTPNRVYYGGWIGFYTGAQQYEFRAFGMDFEGVVKYGEWKPYIRPLS